MSAKKLHAQKAVSNLPEEDKIRLPPFLGIRPGVYLAALYGVIILIILFILLLWPGIFRPGSVLSLSSEPLGAACRIDGFYQEASPCDIFVSIGKHRLEMTLPGFGTWTTEIEVPNRVFASRFFPLKTRIHGELKSDDPAGAFRAQAAEFAAWTFAGEPASSSQIPLSLSDGAYRLGPEASDPATGEAMKEILSASLRFGVTRASLRDLLRAKFLIDNRGLSPSPLGFLGSAADVLCLLDKNPGAAAWLADLLQGDAVSLIAGSTWYEEEISNAAALAAEDRTPVLGNSVSVGELEFWEISGGFTIQSSVFPHEVELGDFLISEIEIPRTLWEDFLEERPEWKPENTGVLTEKGLVSMDYLLDVDLPGAPRPEDKSNPVSSLSWYAAQAFCEWFSSGQPSALPAAYSGWEMRLPTEAEWEYAAKALPQMLRNHWEWCADAYAPLDFFPVNEEYDPGSPERSVRGGSWFNPVNSVNAGTRASLPPETCSVFVSFRPILAPKRENP